MGIGGNAVTDTQIILLGLAAYLLTSAVMTYALWVHYLAVMGLQRARDAGLLHKRAMAFGMLTLIKGYLLDVYVNWLVMTPLLLELPRELLVTKRLQRHNKPGTNWLSNWRFAVCRWMEPLLDPYDPDGDHI